MNKAIIPIATSAAAAGVAFLESLRQRARRIEAESCLRLYVLAELDEGIYEVCRECPENGDPCLACFDVGMVPHVCGE